MSEKRLPRPWLLPAMTVLVLLLGTVFFLFRRQDWPQDAAAPSFTAFASPYPEEAAWPAMRGDLKNSGRGKAELWESYRGDQGEIVHFKTDNGIFSTPVIDDRDRVYVGSADKRFYALDPSTGETLWILETNEIIDSAACLGPNGTVYFGGGDGKIHGLTIEGKELWTLNILESRKQQQCSLSTNYWFEGNVVLGPDGALYAPNDDFLLYKISPEGRVLWGFRTGFLIWAAPCFDEQGNVYLSSFDGNLYCLDSVSGRLNWQVTLGNALVSSPALGSNGLLYQGCMDGSLYAVNTKTRKVEWSFPTGGHLYASPALSSDGSVYIGSTSGHLYAVNGTTGKALWSFQAGDSIRSSASLGPDPEGTSPYLIYFGGGNGKVVALEPSGKRRWAYDTLHRSSRVDYPNINASVPLGTTGLAAASANGEVVWIPYDAYLRKDSRGMEAGPLPPSSTQRAWVRVNPGGLLDEAPIGEEPVKIPPTEILSLRLVSSADAEGLPPQLLPNTIRFVSEPDFPHRAELQSDGVTLHLIPEGLMPACTRYEMKISASCSDKEGNREPIELHFFLETEETVAAAQMEAVKVTHMAVPQPAVVPSLDQIGLASLTIPIVVIDADASEKRFLAWGVQRFGDSGVPQKRITLYPFAGHRENGFFFLEARDCSYEITSFPIPLDRFRLAGRLNESGEAAPGGTLLIEKFWGDSPPTILGRFDKNGPMDPERLLEQVKLGGFVQFTKAATSLMTTSARMVSDEAWKEWGLVNHEGRFLGVGTFRMEPLKKEELELRADVEVERFTYDADRGSIAADVRVTPKDLASPWPTVLAILLADAESFVPLPFNLNTATRTVAKGGDLHTVTVRIPKHEDWDPEKTKAYLMADFTLLEQKKLSDFSSD